MPTGSFSFHDDLAGLLAALGIDSAYVLGLSFGGKIAIDFALEHPRMVDALILAGASAGGEALSPETTSRIEAIDALLDSGDVDGAVELELQLWVDGPKRAPDDVDRGVRAPARNLNRHNYEVASDEGTPPCPEPPATARMRAIRVHPLIFAGHIHIPVRLESARHLESTIST